MSAVSFRRFDPAIGIPYASLFDPGVSVVSTQGFEFETRPERVSLRTVSQGTATYEMSGRRVTLTPGDILVAGAGARLFGGTPRRCETTCVTLYLDHMDGVGDSASDPEPLLFHCRPVPWSEQISSQMHSLGQWPSGQEIGHIYSQVAAEIQSIVMAELGRAERLSSKKLSTRLSVMPRLIKARDLIERGIRGPLSIGVISEAIGMAPSHFSAKFREAYDETPNAFHHRMRMAAAWKAVQSSEVPISRVAQDLGFSSAATFARAFRQYFGCSARDLRQKR